MYAVQRQAFARAAVAAAAARALTAAVRSRPDARN